MKGVLPLSLVLALGATAGLALLVVKGRRGDVEEAAPETGGATPEAKPAEEEPTELRPYRTTLTLAEDLRDALAGDPAKVDGECWRVSQVIQSKARWTLIYLAPDEASPRVRALLTLAAGVHVQEDELLLRYLEDPAPVVRRAAALAAGYAAEGKTRVQLLDRVTVPLGRYDGRLEKFLEEEKDETVKAALEAVLSLRR